MCDIFISYSHHDKEIAERYAHSFERKGWTVVTIQGSGLAAAQVHACSLMAERAKKQCCLCCGTQRSGSSDGITLPR